MELLKLVTITEAGAGKFLPSEFVGFISDAAASIIVKIITLQQNITKTTTK
jgi:hypothetical protein